MSRLQSHQAYPIREKVIECPKCGGRKTKLMDKQEFMDYMILQGNRWDGRYGLDDLRCLLDYYKEHDGIPCPECNGEGEFRWRQ